MLKRLAAAGVLSVAVGGVLMSASPAMAGGGYDSDLYSNHHNILANECDINAGNDRGLLELYRLQDVALLAADSANDINAGRCDQANAIINRN